MTYGGAGGGGLHAACCSGGGGEEAATGGQNEGGQYSSPQGNLSASVATVGEQGRCGEEVGQDTVTGGEREGMCILSRPAETVHLLTTFNLVEANMVPDCFFEDSR